MHKKVAVVRTAAVGRSGVKGIIGLIGAGIPVIPIPFGHFGDAATIRDLADVKDHQIWNGRIGGNRRRRHEEKRPVVVIRVSPQEHLVRLQLEACLRGRHKVRDELRIRRVLQAEELYVKRRGGIVRTWAGMDHGAASEIHGD